MNELRADVVIVGGGLGGVACALASCATGLRTILTEEYGWIGGQITSQMTPPDEHGWIEEFGATRTYRRMRERVREFYRKNYPLTDAARMNTRLNPGNGWVSPLCAEPRVFLRILEDALSPFVDDGRLTILRSTVPVSASRDGAEVLGVTVRSLVTDEASTLLADYFVDATETGDLLPLAGVQFVSGAESREQTSEQDAKEEYQPGNSQAFSVCFALSHHDGEDHTVERPDDYGFWKEFVPRLDPPWSGRLLSLTGISPRTMSPVTYTFAPNKEPNTAFAGLWTYRRILHSENFEPGYLDSDVTVINVPQIDFMLGDLCGASRGGDREALIEKAKTQSLSFLYYLQLECGLKGLRLRPDISGTSDGLAMAPYVRESRRIRAEYTVTQRDVAASDRPGEKLGERYFDSVGIGSYRIDLHPTVGGDNYLDVEALPFQIPLGALIPKCTDNLLPACKNIGTTHITNGCFRLHPVEWNIGEAVGLLLRFCSERAVRPRDVRTDASMLREFQALLINEGVELEWPEGLDLNHGDPHRHAL